MGYNLIGGNVLPFTMGSDAYDSVTIRLANLTQPRMTLEGNPNEIFCAFGYILDTICEGMS